MAAVILFLVPMFHLVVFTGLAFWFKNSHRPGPEAAKKLGGIFAAAGALANLVLCVMLIEILSGMSMIAGQDENSLQASMPAMLLTQPVFMFMVYGISKSIFQKAPAKV